VNEVVRAVRQLWLERYAEERRTGHNVLAFSGWLDQKRPELLPRRSGDSPYQRLKSDLTGAFGETKAGKGAVQRTNFSQSFPQKKISLNR